MNGQRNGRRCSVYPNARGLCCDRSGILSLQDGVRSNVDRLLRCRKSCGYLIRPRLFNLIVLRDLDRECRGVATRPTSRTDTRAVVDDVAYVVGEFSVQVSSNATFPNDDRHFGELCSRIVSSLAGTELLQLPEKVQVKLTQTTYYLSAGSN